MTVSLYDASVGTYLRILDSVGNVMDKATDHFATTGTDLDSVVESKLIDDMLPFRFQVVSVVHHSLGAIRGVEAGEFGPPRPADEDFDQLRSKVSDAKSGLAEYAPETVNALVGKDVTFKMGSMSMPFLVEDFLLSFSLPNFYFHATTTYDLLRMQGVQIGKGDFLGKILIKR